VALEEHLHLLAECAQSGPVAALEGEGRPVARKVLVTLELERRPLQEQGMLGPSPAHTWGTRFLASPLAQEFQSAMMVLAQAVLRWLSRWLDEVGPVSLGDPRPQPSWLAQLPQLQMSAQLEPQWALAPL